MTRQGSQDTLRVRSGCPWDGDDESLRRLVAEHSFGEIARILGRTTSAVNTRACRLGVSRRLAFRTHLHAQIALYHARGWDDGRIARALGRRRQFIFVHRSAMGLPARQPWEDAEYWQRELRRKCQMNGCSTLVEVRESAHRVKVARMGYDPRLLRLREARVVDLLCTGSRSRGEIARAVGNTPGTMTHTLGGLRSRGLVVYRYRYGKGSRASRLDGLYSLAPGALERVCFGPVGDEILRRREFSSQRRGTR